MGLLELAKDILGPQPGLVLLLLVLLLLLWLAYRREKLKNDKTMDERLKEAREDTELLVDTVNEAMNTVREFKASNEALRATFDALATAVRDGRGAKTTSGKGGG
jgi:cbb3-type cytochrome oxidase subunit 3